MKIVAATLIALFALVHGVATVPWLFIADEPDAPEERMMLRVPQWARISLLVSCVMAVVGAALLVTVGGWVGILVAGLGLAEICGLAIANGFWMKGRPTVSHHAIRISVAAAILALGVMSL